MDGHRSRSGRTVNNIRPKQFMEWAKELGICPDDRYDEPRCLVFSPYREYVRFWDVPESFNDLAQFSAHVIDGLDPWSYCRIWPRGGYWPSIDELSADKERERLFEAAGVTPGTQGAMEYTPEERPSIIALIANQLHFGCSTGDDIFLIPDHGRQFIQTDHHNVLHMSFADPGQLLPFIIHMEAKGYSLPTEMPVETSRKPQWMQE